MLQGAPARTCLLPISTLVSSVYLSSVSGELPFFVIVFICYYVVTVNGPTSITRLGVLKMCHQIASFWFSPPPTPKILICVLKIDLMNVSEPGRAGIAR